MKTLKIIFTLVIMQGMAQVIFAQNYSDTIEAKKYYALSDKYYNDWDLDSSNIYYRKAADVYKQIAENNNDTLMWAKYVRCLYNVSWNLSLQSKFDNSINILDTALIICLKYLGENHKQTAILYSGFGNVYSDKSENDKALEYLYKSLKIKKELFGEKNIPVAGSYNVIGNVYVGKNEFDLALEYYQKATTNSLKNSKDTLNVYSVPLIKDYLNWTELLN